MDLNWLIVFAVSFISAVLSALGMGGGSILLIYLTVVCGIGQHQAQGINLGFFICTAVVAILFHLKNKLIRWKAVIPFALTGLAGVWFGVKIANGLDRGLLSKLFGGFLLFMGIKEWFSKPKKSTQGGPN